jgi:hypothetical protein
MLLVLAAIGCGGGDDPSPLQPARAFDAELVSGAVGVRPPGEAASKLDATRRIPDGTRIDARRGTVEVTAALRGGGEQSARLSGGQFSLHARRGGSLTEFRVVGPTCPRTGRGSTETRRLFGDGEGEFRTRGRFGAAGVRGTRWGVRDRCDGTLIVAREGTVIAEDFVSGRRVTLRAPRSYLARAR